MNKDFTVFIELEYDINNDKCKILKTNLKKERIDSFLEEWVMTQLGSGVDKNPRIDRDIYNIKLACDLTDDTFYSSSDTGNKGLTTGIVYRIWANKLWEG